MRDVSVRIPFLVPDVRSKEVFAREVTFAVPQDNIQKRALVLALDDFSSSPNAVPVKDRVTHTGVFVRRLDIQKILYHRSSIDYKTVVGSRSAKVGSVFIEAQDRVPFSICKRRKAARLSEHAPCIQEQDHVRTDIAVRGHLDVIVHSRRLKNNYRPKLGNDAR